LFWCCYVVFGDSFIEGFEDLMDDGIYCGWVDWFVVFLVVAVLGDVFFGYVNLVVCGWLFG